MGTTGCGAEAEAAAAAAAAVAADDEVARRERGRISASSISLFDVRPAPNSAVRATLSKWLGGHQRKCLGTTPSLPVPLPSSPSPSYKTLPVFRIIPPQPANFLSRERGGFRLSRKEGKRAEGRRRGRKAAAVRLCRPHRKASPKTWANYFSDLFFPGYKYFLFCVEDEKIESCCCCCCSLNFFFPPKFLAPNEARASFPSFQEAAGVYIPL